ncbi:diguanylate cyclase domain-containing protein [Halomonas sp. 328]|uniref:diguanylate cyclase domain-containing protein n=1 Tax=Halomonas sp. 328 TaxID=2776704 RepID=UPI0018A75599|nr:diguanylate cyclase [Halomonas sp. 328]MBF8224375.1 diguanylate cyclase [Halomonas sp. 328]
MGEPSDRYPLRADAVYRRLFEAAADAQFLVAVEGEGFRYLRVNEALIQGSGIARSAIEGHTPTEALPEALAPLIEEQYRLCRLARQTRLFEQQFPLPGGLRCWQTRLTPLLDERGRVALILGCARDITPLRDFTQTLVSVADTLPGFIYQLRRDVDGHWSYPYVGKRVAEMFGVSVAEAEADAEALIGLIHPDDRERVIRESLECAERLAPWHSEFRMYHRDGRLLWLEANDIAQRLEDGSLVWTGYVNDITAQKRLEERNAVNDRRFQLLVENANDIIYSLTREGRLDYVSPNWTEMLGLDAEAALGRPLSEFIHPEDRPGLEAFLHELFHTGTKQQGVEYRMRHADGNWRWHTSNASPMFDEDGNLATCMGIARDITERRAMEEKIRHMAQHDPLTGLPNRALFFSHLDKAIRLALRQGQPLALMFIDLDKFKPVNDTHGHGVGDRLLIAVARRMEARLRASDVIGRIGGDEFVVLLPLIRDRDDAHGVAEALCAALREPFAVDHLTLGVSASIGLALCPDHAEESQALAHYADQAMYLAKERGRDRVVVYGEGRRRR